MPWITRGELASYSSYSKNQLTTHLFRPLDEAKVLEKNSNLGYRLACDPDDILEILVSSEARHELVVLGFENLHRGPGQILLEKYQLPTVLALHDIYVQASPGDDLDVAKLRETIGLSREGMYENLRTLGELGIINRVSERYKVSDVNRAYVDEIYQRQLEPIVIRVKAGERKRQEEDILQRRREPLAIAVSETFEFPEITWADKNVSVGQLVEDKDEFLRQVENLLTAEFVGGIVVDKKSTVVYSGSLPKPELIDEATVFSMLDFLGIGPEELKVLDNIKKYSNISTIAAALRALEARRGTTLRDQLFILEVKSRLLGLLYGEIFTAQDAEGIGLGELLGDLYEAATPSSELQPTELSVSVGVWEETVLAAPVGQKLIIPKEKDQPVSERLLAIMRGPFIKELTSAASQQSFPDLLMPTQAYNYHRSLSPKADRVPWGALVNFSLGEKTGRRQHPLFTQVGVLVSALFLNESVHARVMAITRGESEGIRMIANHTGHLLREYISGRDVVGNPSSDLVYAQKCLSTLRDRNISCSCQICAAS